MFRKKVITKSAMMAAHASDPSRRMRSYKFRDTVYKLAQDQHKGITKRIINLMAREITEQAHPIDLSEPLLDSPVTLKSFKLVDAPVTVNPLPIHNLAPQQQLLMRPIRLDSSELPNVTDSKSHHKKTLDRKFHFDLERYKEAVRSNPHRFKRVNCDVIVDMQSDQHCMLNSLRVNPSHILARQIINIPTSAINMYKDCTPLPLPL